MSHPSPGPSVRPVPAHNLANLVKLGVDMENWDYVVALAGNPNTGKSTVFNALTGLRQHTGNWPGKTVARAEGGFCSPATSATSSWTFPAPTRCSRPASTRRSPADFILFGKPDVTVIVVDATRLERNLNLVLQVLEITDRVVVCLNLMDEARRHGLEVDERRLARDLGVPVVPTSARFGEGLEELNQAIAEVAAGEPWYANPVGSGSVAGSERGGATACPARSKGSTRSCPTPSGWRCGCWTATSASPRRCGQESWRDLQDPRACGRGGARRIGEHPDGHRIGLRHGASQLRWQVGKDFPPDS